MRLTYDAARGWLDDVVSRSRPPTLPGRPTWTPPDPEYLQRAQRMIEEGAEPHLALQVWLRAHEPPPVPAQNPEGFVQRLEARYSIVLPDDFRRYLLEVAPQTDTDDANTMAWWGVDRIKSLADECGPNGDLSRAAANGDPSIALEQDRYIVFVDYMIWCWAWAVCCSDGPNRGRVAVITGKDAFVADSLSDFIRAYIADPHELAHRGIWRARESGRHCI